MADNRTERIMIYIYILLFYLGFLLCHTGRSGSYRGATHGDDELVLSWKIIYMCVHARVRPCVHVCENARRAQKVNGREGEGGLHQFKVFYVRV